MRELQPDELAELAQADMPRVRVHAYDLAERSMDIAAPPPNMGFAEPYYARIRQFGPTRICMKQGVEAFKVGYECALACFYSDVVPHLRDGGFLEVAFHYCMDSDSNPWGDWAVIKWQITRRYEIT
jgi:hypothetical protein